MKAPRPTLHYLFSPFAKRGSSSSLPHRHDSQTSKDANKISQIVTTFSVSHYKRRIDGRSGPKSTKIENRSLKQGKGGGIRLYLREIWAPGLINRPDLLRKLTSNFDLGNREAGLLKFGLSRRRDGSEETLDERGGEKLCQSRWEFAEGKGQMCDD
jgi:hypothetical protein